MSPRAGKPSRATPPRGPKTHDISVRRIKNGYLIRESRDDGDGNYRSEEWFSPTPPKIPTPRMAGTPKEMAASLRPFLKETD